MLLVLLLALNFGISWWNCYAVGGMWNESKAMGGFARVLAWCGAIQAAIGFSSVFGAIAGYVAYAMGYLPPEAAKAAVSLWYLLVIIPAIGPGLIITIHSWIMAFRERNLLSMGTAAYNTFAQAHNMYGAIDGIGKAMGNVSELFSSKDEDSNPIAMLVIMLVVLALASGILLTAVLIKRYAGRLPLPQREESRYGEERFGYR